MLHTYYQNLRPAKPPQRDPTPNPNPAAAEENDDPSSRHHLRHEVETLLQEREVLNQGLLAANAALVAAQELLEERGRRIEELEQARPPPGSQAPENFREEMEGAYKAPPPTRLLLDAPSTTLLYIYEQLKHPKAPCH